MRTINLIILTILISFHTLCGQSLLTNISNQNIQGTLYGIVTNCDSGNPMQNVAVLAMSNQQFVTETDTAGYYEMVVEDGVYDVEFVLDGYDTILIMDTAVVTGGNTEINVSLCEYPYPVLNVVATPMEDGTNMVTWDPPSESLGINYKKGDFLDYALARAKNFDPCLGPESGTLTPITLTTELSFHDIGIGGLPPGWYAYAISARYTSGYSERVFSNIPIHVGNINVTYNISLCKGSNAENAVIIMDRDTCQFISYQLVTDSDGSATIDTALNGFYDIRIDYAGYNIYEIEDFIIYSDTIIDIELTQMYYPPRNLIVDTSTNIATWDIPIDTISSAEVQGYYVYLDGALVDSTVSDQLSYAFTGLINGQNYNACVAAKYNCDISEMDCYSWESQLLFIDNNLKNSFLNIYPNPVRDYATVKSSLPMNYISITNLIGKEVFSSSVEESTSIVLNTSSYEESIYLVKVKSGGRHFIMKMVVIK